MNQIFRPPSTDRDRVEYGCHPSVGGTYFMQKKCADTQVGCRTNVFHWYKKQTICWKEKKHTHTSKTKTNKKGEAFCEFKDKKSFDNALFKNRNPMGNSYIEIFHAPAIAIDTATDRCNPIIRMRELPYNATEDEGHYFFKGYSPSFVWTQSHFYFILFFLFELWLTALVPFVLQKGVFFMTILF